MKLRGIRAGAEALLACTIFLLVLLGGLRAANESGPPELILLNGKIFTADSKEPWVQALAIRGGRIQANGTTAKVRALAGPETKAIDLGGRTVIPGINDAHNHISLDPAGVTHVNIGTQDPTWAQLKPALAAAVAKAPKGTFIYADIGLQVFHDSSVARDALDQVAPDHAVLLGTLTGHCVIANSLALQKLGIREDVKDPVGGRYERDAKGRLTGVIREYAVLRVNRVLGLMPDDAEAVRQLHEFFAQGVRYGITTTQDMSDVIEPGRAARLFEAAHTPMRIRIMRMPGTTPAGRDTQEGLGLPPHPSAMVSINGTKWLLDGVPLENTLTPRDAPSLKPGETIEDGVRHLPLTFSEKEMEAMLRESLANGSPMLFHVSGYLSAAAMLQAMEATGGAKVWATRRVRFEHGDGLFPDLIPRAKEMGVVVVQNPTHLDLRILDPAAANIRDVQPLRTLLAAGVPVALGSDGPMNPYLNILLACTDPGRPPEAITREQAVIAYTRTSAYAEFAEKDKGTLQPGKLADLAVLSQDIFSVPFPELPKTESVLTLVGGQVVYDAHILGR